MFRLLPLLLFCSSRHEVFSIWDPFDSKLLSNVKNLLASLSFFEGQLEISVGNPRARQMGKLLAVLFVNGPYPIQLAKVFFHLYVGLKDLLLGVESNCPSEHLSRFLKVITPKAEIGIEDP